MKTDNLERYLESFGKYLVKQSRTRLTKGTTKYGSKNVTKALYNSISFRVDVTQDGFSLKLFMLDYGKFIDKGVSGKKLIQQYTTYNKKRKPSPYQYTDRMPPPRALDKWIVKRGLSPRNKKGQFTGRTISSVGFAKSIQFLVARKIYLKGIPSFSFFQKSLETGLLKFSDNILEAVKQDIIDTVNNTE